MEFHNKTIRDILHRHRKRLVVAAVAGVAFLTLGVVGLGYTAYRVATFATDQIKALEPAAAETAATIPQRVSNIVEAAVLNVASGWLKHNIAGGEAAQINQALSCFDALGGPSPAAIIGHVRRTWDDTGILAQLATVSENLDTSVNTGGSAACVNWLFNS